MVFDFNEQPGMIRYTVPMVREDRPLVSIVTPYYNGGTYIWQTCNSVLNQTFPYFEWIVVNDGSTEQSDLAILDEMQKTDPRIRVVHKENGGISSARNEGIRQANTDYIVPLDDDDLIEPTFLEYCWWMLKKNPEAAWAYTDSVGFQGEEYLWNIKFDPVLIRQENLLTATAMIRKQALEAIGLYCESQKYFNEDWHAWLKLIGNGGYPAQSCGEYLFWYRRGDRGVLSTVKSDKKIAKQNREIIASAGREIKEGRPAVIYPKPFTYNWTRPVLSDWNRSFYEKKEKIHVAFMLPHLEMGGADKFNLDLISGLNKERFEISIFTTVQSRNTWLQAFRKLTPNIFNLPNFLAPEDYGEFVSYYIKGRQVDILFVSNSYLGYYLVPWLRESFPDLAIVDYLHMEEWYWRNGGYARTSAMVGGITEMTYVCNNATRNVLISHFDRKAETVQTVYIGVDEQYFCTDAVLPGALYRELNLDPGRPVVLFICRLHPQKRPFLMMEICRKVRQEIPDVVFAVVGDGPQESELKKAVHKQHLERNILFLGPKKDVRPYYRDAKVTLICSIKEGLSLTAYESCAMGVPVVSADVGGQSDLIDSDVGVLIPCMQMEDKDFDSREFNEEEVTAYAKSVVSLLKDDPLRQGKSEKARKKICRSFTVGEMVAFFDKEFTRLATDPDTLVKRRAQSELLGKCAPMSAELYAAFMQGQCFEAALCTDGSKESILRKICRVYRQEGLGALIIKIVKKIMRKLGKIW